MYLFISCYSIRKIFQWSLNIVIYAVYVLVDISPQIASTPVLFIAVVVILLWCMYMYMMWVGSVYQAGHP